MFMVQVNLLRVCMCVLQARTHSRNMASGAVAFGHAGFQQRAFHSQMAIRGAAENVAYNFGLADPATVAVNVRYMTRVYTTNILRSIFQLVASVHQQL